MVCDRMYYGYGVHQARVYECHDCGNGMEEGIYLDDGLYCLDCAREHVLSKPMAELKYRLEAYREDVEYIVNHLSLEDIADYFGGDLWER